MEETNDLFRPWEKTNQALEIQTGPSSSSPSPRSVRENDEDSDVHVSPGAGARLDSPTLHHQNPNAFLKPVFLPPIYAQRPQDVVHASGAMLARMGDLGELYRLAAAAASPLNQVLLWHRQALAAASYYNGISQLTAPQPAAALGPATPSTASASPFTPSVPSSASSRGSQEGAASLRASSSSSSSLDSHRNLTSPALYSPKRKFIFPPLPNSNSFMERERYEDAASPEPITRFPVTPDARPRQGSSSCTLPELYPRSSYDSSSTNHIDFKRSRLHSVPSSIGRRPPPVVTSELSSRVAKKSRQQPRPSLYSCRFCQKTFPREKTLETHERVHTRVRPFECTFPKCEKKFAQSGQLRTHHRLHSGEKPYRCPIEGCEQRFTHSNRRCMTHQTEQLLKDPVPLTEQDVEKHRKFLGKEERDWLIWYVQTYCSSNNTSSNASASPVQTESIPRLEGSQDQDQSPLNSPVSSTLSGDEDIVGAMALVELSRQKTDQTIPPKN